MREGRSKNSVDRILPLALAPDPESEHPGMCSVPWTMQRVTVGMVLVGGAIQMKSKPRVPHVERVNSKRQKQERMTKLRHSGIFNDALKDTT
jgi:hypothetical protein